MLKIEIEREQDGRWIGDVPELPGVLAYGSTEAEARAKTAALALRVIADVSNMASRHPLTPAISLLPHEWLASHQGRPSIASAHSPRMDHRAAERLAPHAFAIRMARLRVCVPRR